MSNYFRSNLLLLREKKGVNQSEVGLQVDSKHTTIGNWERGTTEPSLSDLVILCQYFGITLQDLIHTDLSEVRFEGGKPVIKNTQKGEVSSEVLGEVSSKKGALSIVKEASNLPSYPKVITIDTAGDENTLYVPVKARAGYLSGYNDTEFVSKLPAYRLPGSTNGTFRIFEVEGHSMFNTFHDKDKAIGRWDTISNIKDGRVYVLVTENNGLLIKRLINRYSDGVLICKSDNNHKGEYPPIVLDIHEVKEVWYVTDKWTKQMGEPGEMYSRMIDIEANMILQGKKLEKLMQQLNLD